MPDRPTDDQAPSRQDPSFEGVHDGSYDKLTRPEVELRVPGYFMRFWSQHLSTGAFALYLHLRYMCWYDLKNPQNSRDYCWPKQATLARLIGSSRRSVQRHLQELEDLQLIRRKPTRYYDHERGKKLRGVDVYQIPYRVPLVAEHEGKAAVLDAEDLLQEAAERTENVPLTPERQNDALVIEEPERQFGALVSYPPPKRQNVVGTAAPNLRTEVVLEIPNVTNVRESRPGSGRGSLQGDPRVQAMSPKELESRERMAQEIGRQLHLMAGNGDYPTADHKSLGFHRRVAYLMPKRCVYEALAATRDAVEDDRAGRKTVHTVAAYFAGTVQRIALRERIDLGVEWRVKRPAEAI